ncbi:MAG: phosphoribosylformylglycinamidine synthase subunit PurQ [Phycisphaerales bacterium]|nr:phosphoribosylformylglycinamidine synthase subunit PurQ [Phycisphaerales bacterium]
MPTALIIRTAGTNCDAELVRAFEQAGASTRLVHLDRVLASPSLIEEADLLGFPGGFSYGDDISAGRVFAVRVRERLYGALRDAAAAGTPMIGVCNGFQVLAQAGLLPALDGLPREAPAPTVALTNNTSGRFIDRWVRMEVPEETACVWTRGLAGEDFELPIAHGEGRFVADEAMLDRIEGAGCVAIRYGEAINGSCREIAGICDPSGRVFGLMPHPERFLTWRHHPLWTRLRAMGDRRLETVTPGMRMFAAAIEAVDRVGAVGS